MPPSSDGHGEAVPGAPLRGPASPAARWLSLGLARGDALLGSIRLPGPYVTDERLAGLLVQRGGKMGADGYLLAYHSPRLSLSVAESLRWLAMAIQLHSRGQPVHHIILTTPSHWVEVEVWDEQGHWVEGRFGGVIHERM